MTRINYVAAFYIGPNRRYDKYIARQQQDPAFLLRYHLELLATCRDTDITMGTFMFNDDLTEDVRQTLQDTVNSYNLPMASQILYRPNNGYSYGAWNDAVVTNINEADYFMLIEDDYIPDAADFYKVFVERITDETPFCCMYVGPAPEWANSKKHACSSNGMLQGKAARKVIEQYGEPFKWYRSNALEEAWRTQTDFLDYFTELGYDFRDCLDEYSVHQYNCQNNQLFIFGVEGARSPILPIIFD